MSEHTAAEQPHVPIIQGRGVTRELVEVLRHEIWSSRLKPGQRLNEQRLATQFGLSRPPLREAMRTLEAEGLVVSIPRRGSFVKVLTPTEIREMYAVRTTLEKMAGSLIIARPDLEQVADSLDQTLDSVEKKSSDLHDSINADIEFHHSFVRHSGNARLLRMWEEVIGEVRLALTVVNSEFFKVEYFETTHRATIRTLRTRDAQAVAQQMSHLDDVVASLCEQWAQYPDHTFTAPQDGSV